MSEIIDRYYSMPEMQISCDQWRYCSALSGSRIEKNWKINVSEIFEWVNSGHVEM